MTRGALSSVITLAATLLLFTVPAAGAAELDGVRMADSYTAGNTRLVLNGMAMRDKYFFKVYVGALYLPGTTHNADDVVHPDVPKALVMQFVRDVKRDKMIEAFSEAFNANAPALAAREKADIDRFFAILTDVKDKDRIGFDYRPGKGSTLSLNGVDKLTIEGKAFADLFLLVYVGPHPPTPAVKRGLLGQ